MIMIMIALGIIILMDHPAGRTANLLLPTGHRCLPFSPDPPLEHHQPDQAVRENAPVG